VVGVLELNKYSPHLYVTIQLTYTNSVSIMKELKPAIIEYIQFLSLSQHEREKNYGYTLKAEFARKNKVSHHTLNRWEKQEGFKEKLKELEEKALTKPEERMRTIFKNLEIEAEKGNKKAVEIYMKNLDLIQSLLLSEMPTWEGLIDKIDDLDREIKRKKII